MTARCATLLVVWLLAAPAPAVAQLPAGTVVVVLPFENPQANPRLHWLREGMAALVGDVLDASGLEVVGRDERMLAFDRLQLPAAATLSRASTIRVGQALGAAAVVVGRVELTGDDLVVSARLVRLDSGRLDPDLSERAPLAQVFGLAARVARQLAGASADTAPWQPPPSPPAFELFIKGLIADTPAARRTLLAQALEAAPGYDQARLALWQLHTDQGDHQRAFDSASGVAAGSAFAREARFAAAMSLMQLKRDDEAFATLRALQHETPLAAVANAIGVVQLRRGSTPQTGPATYYFNQASELDPTEADYFFNLGYAYWLERDANGAAYWLREAVRRNPTDGDAHMVLSAALQQAGAVTEAARERELAERLSSRYAAWKARAAAGGDLVPRGLERLHDRLDPPAARVDTIMTASGQRDQAALSAFHLDAARRAFDRESDREAVQELRRALYLSPYLAEAHVLLGRLHLRAGRAADAVQALKIAVWSEESAAAQVALGEAYLMLGDAPAARASVERALALDPRSAAAADLRARLPPPR